VAEVFGNKMRTMITTAAADPRRRIKIADLAR
jgi:hypothetical protein